VDREVEVSRRTPMEALRHFVGCRVDRRLPRCHLGRLPRGPGRWRRHRHRQQLRRVGPTPDRSARLTHLSSRSRSGWISGSTPSTECDRSRRGSPTTPRTTRTARLREVPTSCTRRVRDPTHPPVNRDSSRQRWFFGSSEHPFTSHHRRKRRWPHRGELVLALTATGGCPDRRVVGPKAANREPPSEASWSQPPGGR